MPPFRRLTNAGSAATEGMARPGNWRHGIAFQPYRSAASRPTAARGALAIAGDRLDREQPWSRQVSGIGLILGLALRGSAVPVEL